MKISLIVILFAVSLPVFASVKTYQNNEGCKLVVEDRDGKVTYTLSKDSDKEVVTFSPDYMSVEFSYCPEKSGEIYFTEGSAGYGLMVFCDQDEQATQRGVVDLEVRNNGVINSFSVTSEVKDANNEWKENKNLSCSNFLEINE